MWQVVIGGQKNYVSIKYKLESITTYHIRFVVKLFSKCFGCSINLIFVELKLL